MKRTLTLIAFLFVLVAQASLPVAVHAQNILGVPAYLPTDCGPNSAVMEQAENPAFVRIGVPEGAIILSNDFSRIDATLFYNPGKKVIVSIYLVDGSLFTTTGRDAGATGSWTNWTALNVQACAAVAQQYACNPWVYAIEPMNEPWYDSLWIPPTIRSAGAKPADFTLLANWITAQFSAVYPAVKQVNPAIQVIGPDWAAPAYNEAIALSTNGFACVTDGYDWHDYNANAWPHLAQWVPSLPTFLGLLRRCFPAMPFYVTEVGLNTNSTPADTQGYVNLHRAYGTVALVLESPYNGTGGSNDTTATWASGAMLPHAAAFIKAAGATQ